MFVGNIHLFSPDSAIQKVQNILQSPSSETEKVENLRSEMQRWVHLVTPFNFVKRVSFCLLLPQEGSSSGREGSSEQIGACALALLQRGSFYSSSEEGRTLPLPREEVLTKHFPWPDGGQTALVTTYQRQIQGEITKDPKLSSEIEGILLRLRREREMS